VVNRDKRKENPQIITYLKNKEREKEDKKPNYINIVVGGS